MDYGRLGKDTVIAVARHLAANLRQPSDEFVLETNQIRQRIDHFPDKPRRDESKYQSTAQVYNCFRHLVGDNVLPESRKPYQVYPRDHPYKGEFLTDFAIYEPEYGFRIACESQLHEGPKNEKRVSDAIDKLLHVKADIKLLVFEDSVKIGTLLTRLWSGHELHSGYKQNYLHFYQPEHFLFLQWDGNAPAGSGIAAYCCHLPEESELEELAI